MEAADGMVKFVIREEEEWAGRSGRSKW